MTYSAYPGYADYNSGRTAGSYGSFEHNGYIDYSGYAHYADTHNGHAIDTGYPHYGSYSAAGSYNSHGSYGSYGSYSLYGSYGSYGSYGAYSAYGAYEIGDVHDRPSTGGVEKLFYSKIISYTGNYPGDNTKGDAEWTTMLVFGIDGRVTRVEYEKHFVARITLHVIEPQDADFTGLRRAIVKIPDYARQVQSDIPNDIPDVFIAKYKAKRHPFISWLVRVFGGK